MSVRTDLAGTIEVLPPVPRRDAVQDGGSPGGPDVPVADVPTDLPTDVPTADVPTADVPTLDVPGVRQAAGSPRTCGPVVVVEALNRAAAAVRHHVEHEVLRGADLSWTGYAVLVLACQQRSIETRAAAAAIGISRGTLTGVVHTLESKELIRRLPHSRDGRLVLLEPTAAGRRLGRRLGPRVRAAEDGAIGALDLRERAALTGLLDRVVADLNPDTGCADEGAPEH